MVTTRLVSISASTGLISRCGVLPSGPDRAPVNFHRTLSPALTSRTVSPGSSRMSQSRSGAQTTVGWVWPNRKTTSPSAPTDRLAGLSRQSPESCVARASDALSGTALQYARDRVQGRPIDEEIGAPIVDHPDVRRMLMHMKTRLMGARAICMATAAAADLAECAADEDVRKAAHRREALLTPVAKSYGSDLGVEAASIGVQVHGGMGLVEETGAAQHYRDARIAPIYEGTNGIQAIDLVGRKLRRDGGEAMREMIAELRDIHARASDSEGADLLAKALGDGIETMATATDIMLNASDRDALAGASGDADAGNMGALATYHALRVMPEAASALDYLRRSSEAVFGYPENALADL